MIFTPASIAGAWVIDPAPIHDERGFFARSFCAEAFARHGLAAAFPQCNISYSRAVRTLRGLHGTQDGHAEAKLVRCTAGEVWDVAVDGRSGSPSFGHWHAVALTARNRRLFYIPAGCLHGFLTLTEEAELFYQMSVPYRAEAGLGVRWDDPDLAIAWPMPPAVLSARDAALPSWREAMAARARAP